MPIEQVCNTSQPVFGLHVTAPELQLSTTDGPFGSQFRPWQSQFSSINALSRTLGDRTSAYLYLEVFPASTETTRRVIVHLCDVLVPVEEGIVISSESQLYRRCGDPEQVNFPTSCYTNVLFVEGGALNCLCQGREAPDIVEFLSCDSHCQNTYDSFCVSVNLTHSKEQFIFFTRQQSSTTTTTPNTPASGHISLGTEMERCYSLSSDSPFAYCADLDSQWCKGTSFQRVGDYRLINGSFDSASGIASLGIGSKSVASDLVDVYNDTTSHIYTACVCRGHRSDGWFREMMVAFPENDLTTPQIWYNASLTVRDFWPIDEDNHRFLQMYSVRGPLVIANNTNVFLHPNASGSLKPSPASCRSMEKCSVIEPVIIDGASSRELCQWNCVLLETVDIQNAPIVSVSSEASDLSQCPPGYILANMIVVSWQPKAPVPCW